MGNHIGGGVGRLDPIKTYALLDQIVTVLGATKLVFYPFITGHGTDIIPYGTAQDAPVATSSDEGGAVALESEFDPVQHVGGIFSYYNDSSTNNHINCGDDADFSHIADTAMSVGGWIYITEALGTARSLIAKFGSSANLEEYRLQFDTSGNILFELHDASASQKELATGSGDVLVPWRWQFVVATYDGAETTPDVHLYKNASDTNATGATVEDGGAGYSAMEDTASELLIGCDDATGTPANEFEGRIALPFVTGKELTAANVTTLYGIGRTLLGI